MQCFAKETLEKIIPSTRILYTNAHTICGRPTLKNVKRFLNRSAMKTLKMCNRVLHNEKQMAILIEEKAAQRHRLSSKDIRSTLVLNSFTLVCNYCAKDDLILRTYLLQLLLCNPS